MWLIYVFLIVLGQQWRSLTWRNKLLYSKFGVGNVCNRINSMLSCFFYGICWKNPLTYPLMLCKITIECLTIHDRQWCQGIFDTLDLEVSHRLGITLRPISCRVPIPACSAPLLLEGLRRSDRQLVVTS